MITGDETPAAEALPEAEEHGARLWEQVATVALAVLLAFSMRACVIEPFRIPSGSMLPTLLIGDHLFVNKFAYGMPIPFTHWRLPSLREPARGDVIVFTVATDGLRTMPADRHPELPREQFVKRIIGVAGDRIEFVEGDLLLNGAPVPQRREPDGVTDERGQLLDAFVVNLPERSFRVLKDPSMRRLSPDSLVVEPGRYFVMGDNRDHSEDSRFWGTVRRDEIRGPAVVLYWSWDFQGSWADLLDPRTWWHAEKRWDRIGDAL